MKTEGRHLEKFFREQAHKKYFYISKDKERVGFVQIAKANLVYDPQNAITHRIIEYMYFFNTYKKYFFTQCC